MYMYHSFSLSFLKDVKNKTSSLYVEGEAQISMLICISRFSLLCFRRGLKDMRGGHDERTKRS